MPRRYNAEFESQIASYRSHRRMLVAHNIEFRIVRTDFETIVRAALRQPNSVTFFWPPSTEIGFRDSQTRHQGYVMLGFQSRRDRQAAEEDLQNLVVGDRAVGITRSSRVAYAPSDIQAAAPAAAVASATAASATAPTASAPTASAPTASAPAVPAPAPIALTTAAAAAATTTVTEETDDDLGWEVCSDGESDWEYEYGIPEIEYED